MKIVRLHSFDGFDGLRIDDVPIPEPGPGEALVRIHAASINPVEWKTCFGQGLAPRIGDSLPYALGTDVSGVIESFGPATTDLGLAVGDAVCGMVRWPLGGGGYAEYIAAAVEDIIPKPAGMTHGQAAGLPLVTLTAYQAMLEMAELAAGQTVLIHAAAGGVGHVAVQLAKWRGAEVIAMGSARNEEFLLELGADRFIDYNAVRFEDEVHDVDVVLDGYGGDLLDRSWSVIRPGGFFASIRGVPDVEVGERLGIRSGRISVVNDRAQFEEIAGLVESGQLRVHVDATFPLADVRKAYELSRTGHVRGKIVLEPSSAEPSSVDG